MLPSFLNRMAIIVVLSSIVLNTAFAADWPTFRGDNRRSGFTAESFPAKSVQTEWTYQAKQPPMPAWPGPARWDSYANVRGLSSMRNYDPCFHVAVVGERLYYGSSVDDSVHAIDVATGKTAWTFTTDAPVRIAPTVADGKVYFGSDDGCAYCVSAADGNLVWKSDRADDADLILNNGRFVSLSPCRTGVLVDDGRAYFGQGMLPWRTTLFHCVDPLTGKADDTEESKFYTTRHFGLTLEGALLANKDRVIGPAGRVAPQVFKRDTGQYEGTLAGSGGSAVVMTDNGHVLCGPGNKTGWTSETNIETRKQTTVHSGKVVTVPMPNGRVMVSRSRLTAYDKSGETTLWDIPCRHHNDLIVAGGTVITGGDGIVVGYSLKDGTLLWDADVQGQAFGLAIANGRLYASTDEGFIHCLRPVDTKTEAANESEIAPAAAAPERAAADSDSAAKDREEDQRGLLGHWQVHRKMSAVAKRRGASSGSQRLSDLTNNAHAVVTGEIHVREVGGAEALEFDGESVTAVIADDLSKATLPAQNMTAEAWVRVDEPDSVGGIIGCTLHSKEEQSGWALGFHHSRFLFAIAGEEGAKNFTYVRGETLVRPGHWYHVVATYDGKTARLSVNGKAEAESTAQSGPIDYPENGPFQMGLIRQGDNRHYMYGMLHETRLYDRVVTDEEIQRRHEAKRELFNVPIELATPPYLTFVTPDSARVRWHTDTEMPTRLVVLGGSEDRRFQNATPTKQHDVIIDDLPRDRLLHYAIEKEENGRVNHSLEFELDTHFNFAVPAVASDANPFKGTQHGKSTVAAATHILNQCNVNRGVCLMIGIGDGQLAWELAKDSELRIIGVDTDAERIEAARSAVLDTGAYGRRIAFHHVDSYANLPFVGRFANLIVSGETIATGKPTGDAAELFRVLRPNGGLVCIGQPAGSNSGADPSQLKSWLSSTGLTVQDANDDNGNWITATRPSLEGAGDWSHLYGRADNSAFGGESLGGASTTGELAVQWIGRPGPRAQPDRNGRKPSPLSTNGRLYVQGLHRLIAVDAFNGTVNWALELPALERFNMPRDCSNWCADDEYVYIAAKGQSWQIDAATGEIAAFHPVADSEREDWSYDWGYISQVDDLLLGSSQKEGSAFVSFWGDAGAGWYDARSGPATFKVCSDSVFARHKSDGKLAWQYENGVIVNSTITVANGNVHFVETRHPKVKQAQARRVGSAEMWAQQYLVSLDLKTGEKVWEKPLATAPGTVAFYLAAGEDALVINSSTNKKFEVSSYAAADGKTQWKQTFGWYENKGDHGKAIQRPAILNGRVYIRPKVLDLKTGELQALEMPSGKCGTYAATTKSLVFRTTKITMWNTESGSASSWDRMRPGCWLSTIPANGMLLSPEGGGGCSCGSWMEMSVGFMPISLDAAK